MWISGKQIGNAWRQTRGFLKSTYHEGKKWANMIDGYASLFRKGLSAAAPMLQDLGAGEALGSGVKALQSYDTVRKQVMDVDERGREHVGRIGRAMTQDWPQRKLIRGNCMLTRGSGCLRCFVHRVHLANVFSTILLELLLLEFLNANLENAPARNPK